MAAAERERICIAVLALGGQGGGVLATWIEEVARRHRWFAQGTSVPGVAQRTGSTVYYIELSPPSREIAPVMASMPVPGDVDVVVTSELMEMGRAMLRGFVSAERTVLIGSTHRVYAIAEKSALGDGRGRGEKILEAARERSRRFVGFDMEAETQRSGSAISAVMFGALAGSGCLPFSRDSFEEAIRASGFAVEENLAGFAAGFAAAQRAGTPAEDTPAADPVPTTPRGAALAEAVRTRLPRRAHRHALLGLQRLMDYQDPDYAELYLERLSRYASFDPEGELASELARHLALWMSYDDTIRVADLKTRGSRFERVRREVGTRDEQTMSLTEFMHPRLEEVCDTLPAALGARILASPRLSGWVAKCFQRGRHVETSRFRWFAMLRMVAGLRRFRRSTLRYRIENERIERWLGEVHAFAKADAALATEWVRCQRLVKGYGDTFERGLRSLEHIREALGTLPPSARSPGWLVQARNAALADDAGRELSAFLQPAENALGLK